MFNSIKVSAISLKPIKWDKSANADKMEMLFLEAAKDTPQLILTTEGVLEGYVVMDVIEHPDAPCAGPVLFLLCHRGHMRHCAVRPPQFVADVPW